MLTSLARQYNAGELWKMADSIDYSQALTPAQKLNALYGLKKNIESYNQPNDSVYAKILHKIGKSHFFNSANYDSAFYYTLFALRINTSGDKGASLPYALYSYYNAGFYFEKLSVFNTAIKYFDSTIALAKKLNGELSFISSAMAEKSFIYFKMGDYQKAVDESTRGIAICLADKDSVTYMQLLNQRAQSLFFQNQVAAAFNDAETVLAVAKHFSNPFQMASAYKITGFIYAKKREINKAEFFFSQAIIKRAEAKVSDKGQVAADYNDFANFCKDTLHDFSKAEKLYILGLQSAKQVNDSARISLININLGNASLQQQKFKEAHYYFNTALQSLQLHLVSGYADNPASENILLIGNKGYVLDILTGKTSLLLEEYKRNKNRQYLNACLQTAKLADTVLSFIRHEQTGEQSKLYWRNYTRDFFTVAMEASYLADDAASAFYFMEQSRSVLLNDKINELGAQRQLPDSLEKKLQQLNISLITEQQKLSNTPVAASAWNIQQQKLLDIKEQMESLIKFIELQFPSYYQYKYEDKIPSLSEMQQFLASRKQNFIHYFINDTIAYMLGISAAKTTFVRLNKNQFNAGMLSAYLQMCSDNISLNNQYPQFINASHRLYQLLFSPLQISENKIAICADNYIIPFETLCADSTGNNFLLKQFVFSYVYSAKFFMKQFQQNASSGNFIGFAPVQFQPYLDVGSLLNSYEALQASASHYSSADLFTGTQASRMNFIKSISGYKVVNVFSHASAGTSGTEPVLYMQDSLIHLTDLQLLNNTATRLVVLSACETNVGKNATGEGIYSLARGFALAGIPSVAATLWKADEQTIYTISEKFHYYISHGIAEDEALQKAKIDFLQTADKAHQLPSYWANMIFIGNAESLQLSKYSYTWIWITAAFVIAVAAILFLLRRRKKYYTK